MKHIGILGGGQLARFLCMSGQNLGYTMHVFDPDPFAPARYVANKFWPYDYNSDKLDMFFTECDVIIPEFENIDIHHPQLHLLQLARDRAQEKALFHKLDIPYAESVIFTPPEIPKLQFPAIIKTCLMGYDGKGQFVCPTQNAFDHLWPQLSTNQTYIAEKKLNLKKEFSLIAGRNHNGAVSLLPAFENLHIGGILHVSRFPARISETQHTIAQDYLWRIINHLNVTGIITLEFFIDEAGVVYANEIAPRVHNSGHLSLDALSLSQFELNIRASLNLPFPKVQPLAPYAAMINFLGVEDYENKWHNLAQKWPNLKLYAYQKSEARINRKMAHGTLLSDDFNTLNTMLNEIILYWYGENLCPIL